MFVRNCWYVAAWDHDVPENELYAMSIINEPVVIFRQREGSLVAMENRCCHRFAPLSKGRLEDGCNLRCMYHGLKFAPDGRCIEIPGQDRIPDTARVRTYPVESRHGWIWVWMGDADKADPALIPQTFSLDDPNYVLRTGHMDYKAHYQLINDNLTDFSHVSYVHANSFGVSEYFARVRPTVKPIDRGIRVTRWISSAAEGQNDSMEAPVESLGAGAQDMAVFQTYDFLAPGILIMYTAFHHPDDVPADGISRSEAPPLISSVTSQAVTPMTDGTTRYFFSWGPHAHPGAEKEADAMLEIARKAFAEDLEMIEAQQATIDQCGEGREMLTTADVGPVQMRAVIRKLARAERGDTELADDVLGNGVPAEMAVPLAG